MALGCDLVVSCESSVVSAFDDAIWSFEVIASIWCFSIGIYTSLAVVSRLQTKPFVNEVLLFGRIKPDEHTVTMVLLILVNERAVQQSFV